MPDYTDPRKVGIAGLRGINRMTPATSEEENTVLKNMSRHSASSLSAEYMPNPQKPVGLEMGNLGYGTSKYDINNYNASTFREDANETRAQNQGIFATLGNGLMRGVGTFGTSLVDTTAGFLTGLGYAAHDWVNGAGFMEGLGEIGRNPISQGMSEFNDKMREWFPTYKTSEEQNGNWLANIFTHPVNFFSDQLENVGFMAAGALTGKIGVNLTMKVLDGISSLGKMGWLASARNVRTAFNDINTIAAANGTSVNNVLKAAKVAESGDTSLLSKLLGGQTDFSGNFLADLHQKAVMARHLNLTMQSVGSIGSSIGEGAFQAATDSRDKYNMGIAQIQDALPKIELQERQKLFESNPGLFTTAMDRETGQMQVIPTEAGQRVLNQRMTQVRNSMMSRLEEDTKKMAGLDFLSNLFILTGSSWATFGKYFTSGFRTARGAATKGITKDLAGGAERDISQTLKDYAAGHPMNEGVRPLSSDLKKRVTGNALEGTLQYHKRSAFEKAANALIAPVAEGNEELLQQAATFGSGYTYDDTPDDLYHARHSAKYGDALASLWKGAVDTYSDYDQWQQFAAAFISTAMGIPVLKGKRIGFAGGIYGNIKDQNAEDARNAEQVELGNIAGKRMKDRFQQYVAGQLFDDGKAKALKEGDEKKYRDYDDSSMISDAISIAKTGRINEVMEMMKPFAEMSPDDTEALQRFYDATSQAQTKQDGTIDDTLPKINSFFPKNFDMNDASQRKQMTDEINKRASKIIDTVNKAEQISSDLLQRTGDVYTDDDLDFLTWSSMKAERWNDRIQQTYDKVQNYLKDSKVKLGGTYIGSDNMEHPMTDILHMDKQEFANELYASMVAMDIRSKIAESPRDNTEDETVVGEEKQKVEKPHLPESNLAERLTSKDVIGNVDKLTDKAGEFIQDMKDVVSMALNRSSFIRMYNNYMTNPESLRARNEAVREKELGRLENIHASKLYEELSKADNIDQFREIINTSDNAVSDKVISQTLETLASSELPGREIAGTMLKEFNNQQKKKDYFQWVRDRIDRKKTRESGDTATEETKKSKTEEAVKTKKKPLSEETANSGEPVKKQPEVTMTFVTDEEMAERIEHEMNAANKTSAATDKKKVSPDKTDKSEAPEPTEGTELPADNHSEEQSAETTESSQADTDEGIATFSSSEHSDNVTNSNIPPVSVPEQKSTEEVRVESERQKKEDVFSGKDTSVWKPSMSEFVISDMNNDRYIPLDVTNPAYKYIFKFLRENTDALNLEGNLKKTDKIIFRITPAYKNPDGYNDTEHHHDVKDKKSYTVFMVNKRTGRIVGVCDSYELASKMNRKSMTDFLSDLFDAYNKYLDSPEFDKNKDWDYKDSKGKPISVTIKNLIGGRVKYASQSEDRNVRNRALGSLMENYKKDIPADRKLPLRLGIATSKGMMANVYEAVPVSNVINFKDMDYWGRAYLLIPGLDSKYRAVHLDRIPFTMSAYNEMKDGNNLYGSLRTALEDFTPKLKGVLDKGVEGLKELSSSTAIFNNVVTDFRNQIGSILYLGSGLQVYINTDKFGNVSVRFKNEEQTEANQKRNYSVNITVGKIQQDGSIAVVNDIAGTILSNLNNFIKSKFGNTNFNIVIAGLDNQKYIQRLINTNFLFAGIQDAEMAAPFFTLNPPASSVKEVADNTRKAVNEAVENKPSNTVKTVNNKEKRRLKLRKSDKKDGYTIWNKQKELSWLKHTFPQLTLNERILLVKGIPNINNVEAYGYFKDGIITLGTMAEEGTLYHEAFHYVFNMLSSDEERRQIYDEAKKLYGDKSNLELEELLAEDFRKYIMTGIYPVENNGNNIFNRIKNFFKSLFIKCHIIKNDHNVLDTYFRNINRGKYANMKEVEGRPSVTRMNKNTEEEETILKNAKRDSKGRLLAPNGKPSNLTERQYAQVRTKAFKEWFGDWEKEYTPPRQYGLSTWERTGEYVNIPGKDFLGNDYYTSEEILSHPVERKETTKEDPFGFNSTGVSKAIKVGTLVNRSNPLNGICQFTAQRVQAFLKDRYGIDAHSNIIDAKSPVTGEIITHHVVALTIDGKPYIYDMPQTEFISTNGNKFNVGNKEYKEAVITKEYAPRLIEISKDSLLKNYGDSNDVQMSTIKSTAKLSGNIKSSDIETSYIPAYSSDVSKVVDENGEPLVVYHGTSSAPFTIFDKNKIGSRNTFGTNKEGFYFTDSKENAKSIAIKMYKGDFIINGEPLFKSDYPYMNSNYISEKVGYKVSDKFADIETAKSPYDINVIEDYYKAIGKKVEVVELQEDSENIYPSFLNIKEMSIKDYKGQNLMDNSSVDFDNFVREARDGGKLQNVKDGKFKLANTYFVKNANQVKSATDNIGTYDESNDDIRYRKVDNSNEIERFSNDIMVEADKQLKNETDNSVFSPQYKKKFLVLDDKLSRSFNNYRSKAMKGDKYGFPKMFWDDKHGLVYIKSNNHRNSRRYNLVSTDTGEVLYSNMLLYTKEEAESSVKNMNNDEENPTKLYSLKRTVNFALYKQMPSKETYKIAAKRFLYDALKNTEDTINFNIIDDFVDSLPEGVWEYISTTSVGNGDSNITADTSIRDAIFVKLPKLGLIKKIEKELGIELYGKKFTYNNTHKIPKWRKYKETVTIDNSLSTSELKNVLEYYLSDNHFKKTTEEENIAHYAQDNGMTVEEVNNIISRERENDDIAGSKMISSIRNYNWQFADLARKVETEFNKEVVDYITERYKDSVTSEGNPYIKQYFSGLGWLNINFNKDSGKLTVEDADNLDIDLNKVKEEEPFMRLASIIHEPFHALHALIYGSEEERQLRESYDKFIGTNLGKMVLKSASDTLGKTDKDVLYKEISAYTFQLLSTPPTLRELMPETLLSAKLYEFIKNIETSGTKYDKMVMSLPTDTQEIKENKITLNFFQKLYNALVSAIRQIAPRFGNLFKAISDSYNESNPVESYYESKILRESTDNKYLEYKQDRDNFLNAFEDYSSKLKSILSIDSSLLNAGSIPDFFKKSNYNQSRERAKWENQPIGTEKVGNNYWRYRGTEEYKSLAEKYMFDSYVADAKMKNSLRTTYAVARAFYDKVRATLPAASVSIVKKSGSDYWKIELRKMKESINKEYEELDNWNEISTFDSLPKDLQDTYIDLGIGPDDYNWLPSGLKKTMSICS